MRRAYRWFRMLDDDLGFGILAALFWMSAFFLAVVLR